MDKLVVLEEREPVTTSKIIAKGVGINHQSIMELIRNHQKDLEKFGVVTLGAWKPKTGRPGTFFYLNEPQTTFLITLMKNVDRVVDFKVKLIKEFFNLKKALSNIAVRQQNTEWLETRNSGKVARLYATDAIKDFVEYAKEQGSTNAERYYGNITKMENRALFVLEQKFDNIRQVLTGQQLGIMVAADKITETAMLEGMKQELHYKDIYKLAKKRVEAFAEMIPKTPVPMLEEIRKVL